MFDATKDADQINRIAGALNEHSDSKTHSRHFDIAYCKTIGLKIRDLEDDQKFQDAVLSLHHSYIFTMESTNVVKIIENQRGKALVSMTKT